LLENERRRERRKKRKKERREQTVSDVKKNFQAATESLLRFSSLSRSLTGGACFAIRERGECRLLENERRRERRKKRKKERREQIVRDITEELSS